MSKTLYQIYDKTFKKILTLSSKSVINLINGMFDANYPTDSTVTYNWTEFENDELRCILADTILTINGRHSYHLEAQMTEDENIIFRVFAYGYGHAERNRHYTQTAEGECTLRFPEPKIIYLSSSGKTPDEYTLRLDFGSQGIFLYRVSAFKFLDFSAEELNRKKMIILIPFLLLKLRDNIKKDRSKENLEALKVLIQNDIIENIEENLSLGNITAEDARLLRNLTHKLYQHIYAHYDELEEISEMTDQSLLLDIEIAEMKLLDLQKKYEKELAEKDAEIARITKSFDQKDAEIASLKIQLANLIPKK